MKTTVELADPLLEEAKELARREGVTLRSLLEEGLEVVLQRRRTRRGGEFRLRDASFRGDGPAEGVDLRDWDAVMALAYEGREP